MYGIVYFTDFSSHSLTVSLYKQQFQIVHESFHTVFHTFGTVCLTMSYLLTLLTLLNIVLTNSGQIKKSFITLVGTGNRSRPFIN